MHELARQDFEQAMGAEFGEALSPPIPFELASPHECCEVIGAVLGVNITPTDLAALTEDKIKALGSAFGAYFECETPTTVQVLDAVSRTIARWPVGSLGETGLRDP